MAYSLFRITEYDSNASWNSQQSLFFRPSVLKMTHLEQKSMSTRKLILGKLTFTSKYIGCSPIITSAIGLLFYLSKTHPPAEASSKVVKKICFA